MNNSITQAAQVIIMSMKSPFDIPLIRSSWQALSWQAPQIISGEPLRYARYYGLDLSQRFPGLKHAFGYFNAANHTIAVHSWMPIKAKGTVLVCHGYFDHVGLYSHIIEHLLELNYAVLAYDLPGHGLSSGPQAAIDDFHIYQDVLTQCLDNKANSFPKPWHALAQSTGGAIIMEYALFYPHHASLFPFEQIILLAPLVRPRKWRNAALLHSLVSPFRAYIPRTFSVNSSDTAFTEFQQHQDPLQSKHISSQWVGALKRWIPRLENAPRAPFSPVIIQGDLDETVDWQHNITIIKEKFTEPTIYLLPDARHHLANESLVLRQRINHIIDQHLG